MEIIKKTLPNFVPISSVDNNHLLGLVNYSIKVYNISDNSYESICDLPIHRKDKWKYLSNITKRLFRLVNIIGIKRDKNIFLLIFNGKVYNLLLKERKIVELYKLDYGKRPLSLMNIQGSNNFDDGIYYGDYCSNPAKSERYVYMIDDKGRHKIVFTFDRGKINHIHKLLWDSENDCVWIFTGDFGNAAGIWVTYDNFKHVEPVLTGKQEYRACVACSVKGNIIYATDTPFENNTLRKLSKTDKGWISEKLYDLNGSVIYGLDTFDSLFFSSAVEPNGMYNNRLYALTCTKRGDGIRNNFVYLYKYDKLKGTIEVLLREKKDSLPYVTFQFGSFIFPTICENSKFLPFFNVSTCKNDLYTCLIYMNKNKINENNVSIQR